MFLPRFRPSVGRRALDQLVHPDQKAVAADDGDRERRRENHSQKEEPPQLPALTLIRDVFFYHRLSQNILFDALTKADATNLTTDAQEAEATPDGYSSIDRDPLLIVICFRTAIFFVFAIIFSQ